MTLKTIKVNKELHQNIKLVATKENKTMRKIVEEAFQLYKEKSKLDNNEN